MEAVLCVQDLYKHYPGFALEDVSFSLAPKRIMGLIGKNGDEKHDFKMHPQYGVPREWERGDFSKGFYSV